MIARDSMELMRQSEAAQFLSPPSRHADYLDWSNHASSLFVTGNVPLALIAARRALSLRRVPATLINLAVILENQSDFYSAFPLSEEAYRMAPDDGITCCHYSDALLRMGRFAEAWPIYSSSHTNWGRLSRVWPEWDGRSSLKGKRLLVLCGGGYGDTILHSRWLPRLAGLGARITFMCPASMHPLFSRESYIEHLIAGSVAGLEGTPVVDNDLFVSLLSLARYFCPDISHIPITPYIHPDPVRESRRRAVLRAGAAPVFGICTIAGEEKVPRRNRSLTSDQTDRILHTRTHKGADWVNLNLSIIPGTLQPSIRDWADTAAIIACLDRVITVDTGVAHLAGALGVPCWVILSGPSAAYYGVSGDRNPFYPSQRLFRNGGAGIDNSVSAVCERLEQE